MGNVPLQQEDNTPHRSRDDLVKVRFKTADDLRDAYLLTRRGQKLLLVVLHSQRQPRVYHRSLERADYGTTMADPDGMPFLLHRGSHLVLLTLGTPSQNR